MNEFRVITTTTEEQIFDGKGKRLEVRTSSETVLVSDVIQKTENETEKIDHQEYINSPKWKAKRQMVLERDNFRCRKCGTGKNLDVHHITYEHIGNEPIDDLVTLCRECHESVHYGDIKKAKFGLLKDVRELLFAVMDEVYGNGKDVSKWSKKAKNQMVISLDNTLKLHDSICLNHGMPVSLEEYNEIFNINDEAPLPDYNYDALPVEDEIPLPTPSISKDEDDDFLGQHDNEFPKGF